MTQLFDEENRVHPATVLRSGPLTVAGVRTKDRHGYEAVQVAFGTKKVRGKEKGVQKEIHQVVREFRPKDASAIADAKEKDTFDVSVFEKGDTVSVSAISKGKGFQGVVKRHGFHGGRRSHGQKHSEREPGSIGATGPQRVFKGTRMAGRMGGDRVTVKNLRILHVDPKSGVLVVRGAIPGRRGTLVEVKGV